MISGIWSFPAFTLESGHTLQDGCVAYHTAGRLNAAGDNAVVVGHSLSAGSDVSAWWPGLVGPGRVLDTDRWFVVCANVLGSCYGTTGPLSIDPATHRRYGNSFPVPTIRDTVRLHRRLLDALGVRQVEFAIGGSMGGMQVLEWAFETVPGTEASAGTLPDPRAESFVRRLIPIATGGRHSSWCIAWSEAQRQAIFTDPAWKGGNYTPNRPPERGLTAARMMAMISYRTPESFETRFGRRTSHSGHPSNARDGIRVGSTPKTGILADPPFAVRSYLHHQGSKLVDRFDANSYVCLSRCANSHDVTRGRGAWPNVLNGIRQPTLVVGVDSDLLVPLAETEELARGIPNAEHRILHSTQGHDAFFLEADSLNRILLDWLEPAAFVATS